MLYNISFFLENLQVIQKAVPLQCVFHSIRFKVNKGWSTAVLLFFCLELSNLPHRQRKMNGPEVVSTSSPSSDFYLSPLLICSK